LSFYAHKADGRVIIIASIDQAISVKINVFHQYLKQQETDAHGEQRWTPGGPRKRSARDRHATLLPDVNPRLMG
jgi:hypothetical protein